MTPTLDAALRYADEGWRVFPLFGITSGKCDCGVKCGNEGKHPLVPWKSAATTDHGQIQRWWQRWPNANLAIVTGVESGIYVIDIDNKRSVDLGGGTLIGEGDHSIRQREQESGKLPDTRSSITGSGGTHLLFAYPDGEDSPYPNTSGILPSVDTRGDGGYIVAPPSLHKSGNRYRWVEEDQPIASLPDSWLALLKSGGPSKPSLDSPQEGFKVREGEGRHEWLFRMGAKLRGQNGLDATPLYGALMAYNRQHLEPPLEPRDVEHIVESCVAKYEPEVRYQPVDTDMPVLDEGEDLAVSLFDFLADEPEAFKPLVSKLLHSGECMILGGPPNVGKTWAVMDMMLGISTGSYFANHFNCDPAPVLFIDEEGSRRGDWERFSMLLNGRGQSSSGVPLHVRIDSGIRLDTEKGHTQLSRLIERYKPGAVFLDSLVRVHGGDESNNRSMANLFSVVKKLMFGYGTSFIFTHHIRKPGKDVEEDPIWMLRGASDIQGFPDSIAIFLPTDRVEEVKVVHTKMRNSEKLKPFTLRMMIDDSAGEAKVGYIEGTAHSENTTRETLLKAIEASEDGFATNESLAALTGLSVATVRDHMKVLGAAQHINTVKRGGGWMYQKRMEDE